MISFTFYIGAVLTIILSYELFKRLSIWIAQEIQTLWAYWQKIRIDRKSIVIEIEDEELQPHRINNPRTSKRSSNEAISQTKNRLTSVEEKINRIEQAFGWDLSCKDEAAITVARIIEGNLTYIVVVEPPQENENLLPPGQQNQPAIRPRFIKRPEKLHES